MPPNRPGHRQAPHGHVQSRDGRVLTEERRDLGDLLAEVGVLDGEHVHGAGERFRPRSDTRRQQLPAASGSERQALTRLQTELDLARNPLAQVELQQVSAQSTRTRSGDQMMTATAAVEDHRRLTLEPVRQAVQRYRELLTDELAELTAHWEYRHRLTDLEEKIDELKKNLDSINTKGIGSHANDLHIPRGVYQHITELLNLGIDSPTMQFIIADNNAPNTP